MLVRVSVIGMTFMPTLFATPPAAGVEPNTLICVLQRSANEFAGTCEVPCSVNALAIDIEGPNPQKACEAPPRNVRATLRETDGGNWLGTMQGKFPEDPTRFELLMSSGAKLGIAKTPFGWFSLQSAQREKEMLRLTIAANNQLPPTQDDIRIIQRAKRLLSDGKVWNREDNRPCPAKCAQVEFVLRASASNGGSFWRRSLSAGRPSDGQRSSE
jgi:hypothetical protein